MKVPASSPSSSTTESLRSSLRKVTPSVPASKWSSNKVLILKRCGRAHVKAKEPSKVDILSQLPPELQEKIAKSLGSKDIRSARAVSHSWKRIMDTFHRHNVTLSVQRGFRGVLGMPLESCQLLSMRSVNTRRFFSSSATPSRVTLGRELNSWTAYDLNYYWNDLKVLEIDWKTFALNSAFIVVKNKSQRWLPDLEVLKLNLPNFNNHLSKAIKPNGEFLFAQRYEGLKELSLGFILSDQTTPLFSLLIDFVSAHAPTLTSIRVSCSALSYFLRRHSINATAWLDTYQVGDFDSLTQMSLNSFRFRKDLKKEEAWINFLRSKEGLSRVITEKVCNPCLRSFEFYKAIIQDYSTFLVEIRLTNVAFFPQPESNQPIDGRIFTACVNLESLTIIRSSVRFEYLTIPVNPIEFVQLGALPTSLKHFYVDGFAAETCDIIQMMAKLTRLLTLTLKQDGFYIFVNFSTGFDLAAIEKLITHPSLVDANVTLCSFLRPLFSIRFFKDLLRDNNWEDPHFNSGSTFTRPRITLQKKKNV